MEGDPTDDPYGDVPEPLDPSDTEPTRIRTKMDREVTGGMSPERGPVGPVRGDLSEGALQTFAESSRRPRDAEGGARLPLVFVALALVVGGGLWWAQHHFGAAAEPIAPVAPSAPPSAPKAHAPPARSTAPAATQPAQPSTPSPTAVVPASADPAPVDPARAAASVAPSAKPAAPSANSAAPPVAPSVAPAPAPAPVIAKPTRPARRHTKSVSRSAQPPRALPQLPGAPPPDDAP